MLLKKLQPVHTCLQQEECFVNFEKFIEKTFDFAHVLCDSFHKTFKFVSCFSASTYQLNIKVLNGELYYLHHFFTSPFSTDGFVN